MNDEGTGTRLFSFPGLWLFYDNHHSITPPYSALPLSFVVCPTSQHIIITAALSVVSLLTRHLTEPYITFCTNLELSRDSSVGTAMGWTAGVRSSAWDFFSSPQRSDQLWGLPSLLSNGYRGLYPRMKSSRGVKLTTHHHQVPRSRWSYTSTLPYVFMA
jgi:hypothetical protein